MLKVIYVLKPKIELCKEINNLNKTIKSFLLKSLNVDRKSFKIYPMGFKKIYRRGLKFNSRLFFSIMLVYFNFD